MADLNALIAQGVQFQQPVDPFAQYAKMQQLEQGQRANALAQMQMDKYQQDMQRLNALRSSASPEGVSAEHWRIDPTKALEIAKEQALTRKEVAQTKEAEEKTRASQMKALGSGLIVALKDPSDAGLNTAFSMLDAQNIDTSKLRTQFSQVTDPKQRLDMIQGYVSAHPEGIAAMKFVAPDPVEVKLADGSIKFIDKNPNSPTFKQEVKEMGQATGMTPFQKGELENRKGHLEVAQGQLKVAQDRLAKEGVQLDDIEKQVMAQAIAEGRVDINKVNGRNAKILVAALQAQPGIDLREMSFENLGAAAGARSLGTQSAKMSTAAAEADKMIDIVRTTSAAVDRTQFPTINAIQNAVDKGTGGKEIVQLNAALNSLVNSYARAISPTGQPTVSDKNHAREVINASYSNGQIDAITDIMRQEMNIAKASTAEAGAAAKAARQKTPAAAPKAPAAGTVQDGYRFKGGNPADQANWEKI